VDGDRKVGWRIGVSVSGFIVSSASHRPPSTVHCC
jgi:hypothetical protein